MACDGSVLRELFACTRKPTPISKAGPERSSFWSAMECCVRYMLEMKVMRCGVRRRGACLVQGAWGG